MSEPKRANSPAMDRARSEVTYRRSGWPCAPASPEYLRKGDGLAVARIVKHAQDDRVGVVVAQRHGPGGTADLAAFGLVVPQDVGAQRAFPAPGAGRPVEGQTLRRHQQRGDRVDEGGLARADVAGEQAVPPARLQGPYAPVERAPVEHLEAMKAVAGERVVVQEVEVQDLRFSHGHTSEAAPRSGQDMLDTSVLPANRPWRAVPAAASYLSFANPLRENPAQP